MSSWIVVDLRSSRFAAALLSTADHTIRWQTQPVTIYPLPDTYAGSTETDLTFFRSPNEKDWRPTYQTSASYFSSGYDFIPDLFKKPKEEVQKLLPGTLYPLLRQPLKDFPDFPLVFLVDQGNQQEMLKRFGAKLKRKTLVIPPVENIGAIEGFSLLPLNEDGVPPAGTVFECILNQGHPEQEIRLYHWTGKEFEWSRLAPHSNGSSSIVWDSLANMQRAGTVLFSLFWQEKIYGPIDDQIEELQYQNSVLLSLKDRIVSLLEKLNTNHQPKQPEKVLG